MRKEIQDSLVKWIIRISEKENATTAELEAMAVIAKVLFAIKVDKASDAFFYERIVNLADFENEIRKLSFLKQEMAESINKLADFEFVLEQRKVLRD